MPVLEKQGYALPPSRCPIKGVFVTKHYTSNNQCQPEAVTGPVCLGDAILPSEVTEELRKAPKFSLEPRIPPHELLTLNWRVAGKAEGKTGSVACWKECTAR